MQKEQDIRAQRLAFDKHKFLWESEHNSVTPLPDYIPPVSCLSHNRANSYSTLASLTKKTEGQILLESNAKEENKAKQLPIQVSPDKNIPGNKSEQLKFYQNELKELEIQWKNDQNNPNSDLSRLELRIDQIKNRIAALRGEIAISESTKATRIINSMVVSIKREAIRDDQPKKKHSVQENNGKFTPKLPMKSNFMLPIKPKALDIKASDNNSETKNRRLYYSDALKPRGNDNEELTKVGFEKQKEFLFDLEKELTQKEAVLQQALMKFPGAKEIIDNATLTLNKLNNEKKIFEREKEEFENEKKEWIKNKEKYLNNKN